VNVDFKSGMAVVFAKEKQNFDPVKIPDAIKKAGFSVPKIEIIATGTVEMSEDTLTLRVSGQPHAFALEGGSQFPAFQKAAAVGKQVRITGIFHAPKDKEPPAVTVEKFEEL